MSRPRLSFTTSPQVSEAIEALLWQGLHGRTRAEVVERLVCRALDELLEVGRLKLEQLQERPRHPVDVLKDYFERMGLNDKLRPGWEAEARAICDAPVSAPPSDTRS